MPSTLNLGQRISNESGHDVGKPIEVSELCDLRGKPRQGRTKKSRAEQSLWHCSRCAKGLSGVSTAAEAALVLVHSWCFTWRRNTADHS